jgi:hypothetical protein
MLQRYWPAPALLVWLMAWGLCLALQHVHAPPWIQLVLPTVLGVSLGLWPALAATRWRMVFVAAGFPVSAMLMALLGARWQGGGVPAWGWLLPLGVLLLAYPVRAWRDAPVFPTPLDALDQLPSVVVLPLQAKVLDAGCGLGHGMMALHQAFPTTTCHGIEWSWPLSIWCRLRCPWAHIRRGDMWAQDWSPFDLVYLFQRPESMNKAWTKAQRELKPGAWLVSLEFAVPEVKPIAQLMLGNSRSVWVYRVGA